jgi:hypothetical protein
MCGEHDILIFSTMTSTLYRGKNTRIIKVNPFHDDTTADEKYQFKLYTRESLQSALS